MTAAGPPTLGASPAVAPPRRRKLFKRCLWVCAFLFVCPAAFWMWSDRAAHGERDRMIAERHARGEPVWWHEIVNRTELEAAAETGAPEFLKAVTAIVAYQLGGPPLPNGALVDALDADGRFVTPNIVSPTPQPNAEVRRQLELAKPAVNRLAKALQRKPGPLTGLRGSSPVAILLAHIQNARNLQHMNFWRVYDALGGRDATAAYAATADGFGLAEQLRRDPLIIVQMTRFALQRLAIRQLTLCLEYAPVPEDDYRRLDGLMACFDDSFGVKEALQGECAMMLYVWDDSEETVNVLRILRARQGASPKAFMKGAADGWLATLASPLGRPARVQTEVEELRLYQRIAPLVDNPSANLEEIDAAFVDYERRSPILRLTGLPADWPTGHRSLGKIVVRAHRRLILARLALRLRRYYDQHGKFPDKLDDLCDASMPKLRLDWFGNQPITYKHSAAGFRLEIPKSILQPWEHYHLGKTPIPTEYGLEVELKKYQ